MSSPTVSNDNLTVLFSDTKIGIIEYQFAITFDNVQNNLRTKDEHNRIITREQLITIRVQVEDLPVHVKEKIVDLNCISYDRIFRKKIEIFNESNNVCKIMIKIANLFLNFVEISPSDFFIQAKGSQYVNIKITPTVLMLKKLSYFSVVNKDYFNCAFINLPIEIQVCSFSFFYFFFF